MDILDTCAIRALSRNQITALAQIRTLAISPISLWELLCHLDDIESGEDAMDAFNRRKGQIAKIHGVRILDDPFAQHALSAGVAAVTNLTRFEDRAGAQEIISRIASAESLNALYAQTYQYPDGQNATLEGMAENCRQTLNRIENEFLITANRMRQEENDNQTDLNCDRNLWDSIFRRVEHLVNSYRQDGIEDELLLRNSLCSMSTYYGYILARICATDPRSCNASLARNDTEDGLIVMHLDLLRDDIFVTRDQNTLNAVSRVLSILREHGNIVPRCRVVCSTDYVREFL